MSIFLRRQMLKLHQIVTGRRVLTRFNQLNRTQWLGRDELLALQHAKLQRLLEYVYRYIPYYRRTFDEVGFQPEQFRQDPLSFYKIPIITKEFMRDHVDEFMTTDPVIRKKLKSYSTSGSTGEPFIFLEDYSYREGFIADLWRHLTWCGWELAEPHAYLWGQSHDTSLLHRLQGSLMDFSLNCFTGDAYNLSSENMEALVRQIRQYRPRLLFGYASSLFVFAQFIRERGLDDIKFHAVYSSAEVLYPYQRELIEKTFGCKVFNRYGTIEIGGIACECEAHSGLHISVENCYVEILRDGQPVTDNQPGEIVVTNLNNYGFPFIRYQLKDVVQRLDEACSCGRQSPMLRSVQGRTVDIFRTADGRAVWGDFDSTLFEIKGVKQFQIIQKAVDLILIRIVKDESFEDAQLEKIRHATQKIMGDSTEIRFEFPQYIPISKSGKYRYALSELDESRSG